MEEKIKSYVTKIQELMQDREEVSAGIKMLYNEAKVDGLNIKALRVAINLSMQSDEEADDHITAVSEYLKLISH